MLREMPRRAWKSSNRRTPRNASRTISKLHHSPTTSRHCATEQFMSSKLRRCTVHTIVGSIIERNRRRSAGEREVGDAARRRDRLHVVLLLEPLQPVPQANTAAEKDRHLHDVQM